MSRMVCSWHARSRTSRCSETLNGPRFSLMVSSCASSGLIGTSTSERGNSVSGIRHAAAAGRRRRGAGAARAAGRLVERAPAPALAPRAGSTRRRVPRDRGGVTLTAAIVQRPEDPAGADWRSRRSCPAHHRRSRSPTKPAYAPHDHAMDFWSGSATSAGRGVLQQPWGPAGAVSGSPSAPRTTSTRRQMSTSWSWHQTSRFRTTGTRTRSARTARYHTGVRDAARDRSFMHNVDHAPRDQLVPERLIGVSLPSRPWRTRGCP